MSELKHRAANRNETEVLLSDMESDGLHLFAGAATERRQRKIIKVLEHIRTALIVVAVCVALMLVAAVAVVFIMLPSVQTTTTSISRAANEFTSLGEHMEKVMESMESDDGSYDLVSLASVVLGSSDEDGGFGLGDMFGDVIGMFLGDDNTLALLMESAHRVANLTLHFTEYIDALSEEDIETMQRLLPNTLAVVRYSSEKEVLVHSIAMLEFAGDLVDRVNALDLGVPDEDLQRIPVLLHEMEVAITDMVNMLEAFHTEGIRIKA